MEPTSYKVEVIADASGQWVSNSLRFPTWEAADAWGYDLFCRWTSTEDYRVVASDDPVTEVKTGS